MAASRILSGRGPEDVGAPDDQAPIPNTLAAVDSILRQPRRVTTQIRGTGSGRLAAGMVLAATVCGLVYGVIVGAFSGGTQLWAAPVKVVAGLLAAGLICLPSLYIFACLCGSQARLIEVAGWVAGLVLLMTVLLVGFAPVAWLFSQSTGSLTAMGALHLSFALVAVGFGLRFLNTGFGASEPKTAAGIRIWMVVFVLVLLQMTAALRPLIGRADSFLPVEKKFFVTHWLDCANGGAKRD